ncbi:hypothetical protein PINS_up012253 [Pythium insidiosum]|nr:hypothetical protein PINS_up012253 [Pythium insidiosum]
MWRRVIVVLVLAMALAVTPITHAAMTNVTGLCSPYATPPPVTKGQKTFVCVNVNDKYRTVFMPVADQFTVFRIANSWNDTRIGADPAGAYLTISSMAMRSAYKLYASDAGHIYPFLTAIISVKKGQVQGVSWDDGCYFCGSEMCEPNLYRFASNVSSRVAKEGYTCYNNVATCSGPNATSCDLTIYIGWTGTDSKGNYLSSAGLRMSQFTKYSIGSYFKKLSLSFDAFLPKSRFDD